MNIKSFQHTGIALVLQVIGYILTKSWLLGGLFAAGVFIGREHAQAEARWIRHFGNYNRANYRWYNVLEVRAWTVDSFFWDMVLPIISVLIVWTIL